MATCSHKTIWYFEVNDILMRVLVVKSLWMASQIVQTSPCNFILAKSMCITQIEEAAMDELEVNETS